MDIDYFCSVCGKKSFKNSRSMVCKCGGSLRPDKVPGIHGTRDSFGISKAFTDDSTGAVIDNWKSWEKAGYRNPLETTKNHVVKEKVKEKIDKIRS